MLHLVTFLPLVGAVALLLVKKNDVARARRVALIASGATFLFALILLSGFKRDASGYAWTSTLNWIPTFGIRYAVGIDGISMLLILLITFLAPITLKASWSAIHDRLRDFCFWFLMLETFTIGTVTSRDLFQFFLYWELLLVPMLFIIGRWGSARRVYAAVKFFVYTMVGSLPMLAAIVYLYFRYRAAHPDAPSFLLSDLAGLGLTFREQVWCFVGFAMSFAIKLPLFPLHTWLPDAHTEAPTPGSMVLAGVLLKMGGYGFLAIGIPLFPEAARAAVPWVVTLSLIGIVYGALVAMVQPDLKRLVAFSSVSHMGMVTLGAFTGAPEGISGSVIQMVAHGISTGALFLLVGFLYERRHTRMIADFGGLAKPMPLYAAAFIVVALSSIGLPGTNGFVGELLIWIGTSQLSWVATAVAVSGAVLGAWYLLLAVKRVFFGPVVRAENQGLRDLNGRELTLAGCLIAVIVLTGIFPKPMLDLVAQDAGRLHDLLVPK
jgi:NADH-quinone oxidoreductase subunit M